MSRKVLYVCCCFVLLFFFLPTIAIAETTVAEDQDAGAGGTAFPVASTCAFFLLDFCYYDGAATAYTVCHFYCQHRTGQSSGLKYIICKSACRSKLQSQTGDLCENFYNYIKEQCSLIPSPTNTPVPPAPAPEPENQPTPEPEQPPAPEPESYPTPEY